MAAFKIDLKDLDGSGRDFSFRIDHQWLADALADTEVQAPEPFEPGSIEVRAQQSGTDVLVNGRIEQSVRITCGRCLEAADLSIGATLASLFSRTASREGPADADSPDEIEVERFTGETVVLDSLVRESILVEVPMQPLCRQDCPGIVIPDTVRGLEPKTSDGTPIDPRLAPLLNFKKN